MIHRRGFITALVSFAVTAPAIVRAGSLMPVKVIVGLDFGRQPAIVWSEPPPTLAEWLDEMATQQRRYCAEVGLPYPPQIPRGQGPSQTIEMWANSLGYCATDRHRTRCI